MAQDPSQTQTAIHCKTHYLHKLSRVAQVPKYTKTLLSSQMFKEPVKAQSSECAKFEHPKPDKLTLYCIPCLKIMLKLVRKSCPRENE